MKTEIRHMAVSFFVSPMFGGFKGATKGNHYFGSPKDTPAYQPVILMSIHVENRRDG